MSETAAQRELARQVARLDREAKTQVDPTIVHCAQHGPQYTCADAEPSEGVEQRWEAVRGDDGVLVHPYTRRVAEPTGRWHVYCGHIACIQIANKHCPECETP